MRDGARVGAVYDGVVVKVLVKVTAQFEVEFPAGGAVLDEGTGLEADVIGAAHAGREDAAFGGSERRP